MRVAVVYVVYIPTYVQYLFTSATFIIICSLQRGGLNFRHLAYPELLVNPQIKPYAMNKKIKKNLPYICSSWFYILHPTQVKHSPIPKPENSIGMYVCI